MGFLGVYTVVYDYEPQGAGELELREGDLLCILEKSEEDSWWKAKKKADRDDEDEPEGLVPNNYVEEAQPTHTAKALYDYTRQTDEEVSFSEDADLIVYDTSDPDWTLVGVNGDFGFAPANYIEIVDDAGHAAAPSAPSHVPDEYEPEPEYEHEPEPAPPTLPQRPVVTADEVNEARAPSPIDTVQNPAAAAIANILHQQHASPVESEPPRTVPPPPQPARPTYEPEEDYRREPSPPPPALPQRPPSEFISSPVRVESPREPVQPRHVSLRSNESEGHVKESPPYNRVGHPTPRSPSGYHIYTINEMVEVMGKRKKMPTTLGINVATGTIFISPEEDGAVQEWTADKLTHYSIEGKHVFVDLIRPSKSIDFHAGAKDTAREIVSALGEISGAYRAEGLREVIAAGTSGGQKKGQILYDFMAQGDDEVTVAVGDDVIVLDDSKSEEWWMVRRLKNGKEGVVPSSYIEITGTVTAPPPGGAEPGLSTVEKNRMEEARLTKEASRKSKTDSMRQKRDSKSSHKSKPDPTKVRQWTDRTKTFTVEAQFIGLMDGKIHLHKQNGIKIAVPIMKMSVEDLEYVEKLTGASLDEDKPLSDIKRRSQRIEPEKPRSSSDGKQNGASFQQSDYDWFDFFLKAGVGPHQCERYSQNFIKDSMDEGILPDITPEVLRTLGLKEGDILRVMRYLDNMFGRTGAKSKLRNVSFGGEEVIDEEGTGGLFSGPGGMLRNNTRKGRPAPNAPASDVVDPKAFEQKDGSKSAERSDTPPASATAPEPPVQKGFDDDAWEVKQPKQAPTTAAPAAPATTSSPPPAASAPTPSQPPAAQPLTGAMAELSLLQAPLQPTPAPAPAAAPQSPPAAPPAIQPQPTIQPQHTIQPQPTAVPAPQLQPQATGASPGFFAQLGQPQATQAFSPQGTGFQSAARQRPQAQQTPLGGNSLLPPPPQRPLSAPQNFPQQPSSFGPPALQPQLTGIPQSGPQIAPPGQSLAELNQQRFQPSLQQPQPTGFMPQAQFQNGLMPQPTGFQPQSQFGIQQQQQQTGYPGLAPQPTGFGGFQPPPQQPMQTGINSVLPPPLQPQPTGMNGVSSMPYSGPAPPLPPIPHQPTATPLQPQKTGPAPPIRFGVKHDAPKKLAPQPTGLRANLAQATPTNPFGF
ncbi:hypothetical protein BO86DRAFT_308612 [Aspergillus japonicus CBS 114.51]|uniref:Actin cytoskeleton-regulatory complex protein SLA1 n=1 Tax=Aspergillus japonicus CBS 114.51 TaxID=1448312 RepID=A0A8T8X6S8_ASPJA|nr:hypothetical protein BO86DRAFT_308612 [Aspergillus japonicus CBS 114.51]RAH83867.1 hypothetical protein BO86DRAFT_308612 [Aspergillus japonicus CBS 114.51]